MTFGARFDAALRRRLFPASGLTVKQLAGAIGVSDDTLVRNQRGSTRVFADNVAAMHEFFASRGDAAFAAEVYGITPASPAFPDRDLWALADGTLHAAPFGRARFVIDFHAISRGVPGDHVAAALRNLGWVCITEQPGAHIVVRYHSAGISRAAAARVSGWLIDRADSVHAVQRVVLLEERDGSTRVVAIDWESCAEAATAVELAAGLAHVPPPLPWRNKRLSLDSISHASAKLLARIHSAAPHRLIEGAAQEGLLPECSLFHVSAERVVTLHIGERNPLPPDMKANLVGAPIMVRADVRYGEMIRADLIEASREGPTYRQPHGMIAGKLAKYRRPIFPCGNGLYLSHTEPLVA